MQKTGVGTFKVVELSFDGGQKARVEPQPEMARDRRPRAVSAEDVARGDIHA